MITTDTAVGLVGFYINGAWEKAQGHTTLAVTNPATGTVLANVPFATADDVDRAVRTAHEAFLKWREVPVVDRVQVLYRFKALMEEHAVGSGGHPHPRKRQDLRGLQNGGSPRHPDGGSGLRHAQPDDGRFAERCGARDRLQDHSPAHWRVRGDYAFQLSRHGAAVDVPVRDCLRQHLRAEALGKSSAHADARHRTAGGGRLCPRAS